MKYRYLLGDSRREAARLRLQARLWDPVSLALFDRLRIHSGLRVLEVGPGEGSLHRELRRRVGGPVDAVERSPVFSGRIRRLSARDGLGAGRIYESDLLDAPLPRQHYDLVFARWVFLFLPEPEEHVRKLVRSLRPGGRIALQDYHRETWALVPRPPEWADFLAADHAFFATQGADASVGDRLPAIFRRAGLRLLETVPTLMFGGPGSPVWSWLTSYFLSVADRYARCRPLNRKKVASLRRHWLAAQRQRTSLLIAPAVLDVVGRKPR
jgi:SAM-dependent methyltransferase